MFHAVGFYDVGFDRSVSEQVTWHSSDETVGGFDAAGVFTGRAAGDGHRVGGARWPRPQSLPLEVYAASELEYCDAAAINRGDVVGRLQPRDARVGLRRVHAARRRRAAVQRDRDAAAGRYLRPLPRPLRPTRAIAWCEPSARAAAIRSSPPMAPERDEAALRYQLKAFWDLKDSAGASRGAGRVRDRGRFYLYYDPVVTLRITVN